MHELIDIVKDDQELQQIRDVLKHKEYIHYMLESEFKEIRSHDLNRKIILLSQLLNLEAKKAIINSDF